MYLIRYNDDEITSITAVSEGTEILGVTNKHVTVELEEAIIIFTALGYDVTELEAEKARVEAAQQQEQEDEPEQETIKQDNNE